MGQPKSDELKSGAPKTDKPKAVEHKSNEQK
jgi:hypothetical protein